MNGYNLHRMRLNFRFENPDKCRSIHSELFMYIVDLWNRLGSKEKFGLPSLYTMELLGIGSKNTFYNALNDLVDWGFVKYVQKSNNQNTATIISICYTRAGSKIKSALDTATIQQLYSNEVSGENIDKQVNNITINNKEDEEIIIDNEKRTKEQKDFFWKTFPHARGSKKTEALQSIQEHDYNDVIKIVKLLKREVKEGVQDAKFIPACQRRCRDYTPLSDDMFFIRFQKMIAKRFNDRDNQQETINEVKKDFGEDECEQWLRKIGIEMNRKKHQEFLLSMGLKG